MAFENNYYTEIVFKVKNFAFLLCILEKERKGEIESKKRKRENNQETKLRINNVRFTLKAIHKFWKFISKKIDIFQIHLFFSGEFKMILGKIKLFIMFFSRKKGI